jgi:hypothetical protein
MTFDRVLTIHTVLAAGFGLSLLLAPVQTAAIYGMSADPGSIYTSRLLGCAFVAFAGIAWLMRGCANPQAVSAVSTGFTIGSLAGLVTAVHSVLTGSTNVMTWSTVAIYAFLVIGYGKHALARNASRVA